MATFSPPSYSNKSSDTPTTPATASFDEFAKSRAHGADTNIATINANER